MIFICKYKSIIRQPTYQKMEFNNEKEEHPAYKFFEERDCAYCRVFFEQGKNNCKECGFDLNSWNKEEEKEELCCECCEYVTEYKEDQENKGEFYCLHCFEKRERCECDDCGDMVIADWTISDMGVTFCRPCFAQPRDE